MKAMKAIKVPQQGPFKVRTFYPIKMILGAIFLSILSLAFAAGMLWFSHKTFNNIQHTTKIWTQGVTAQGEVDFDGTVTTRRGFFKSYELKVTFELPSGQTQIFEVEFERFFDGPNRSDPLSVRYLQADPSQATTSWQYEGRYHQWAWFGMMLALGFLFSFSAPWVLYKNFKTVGKVKSLARKGQLIAVDIVRTQEASAHGKTTVSLWLRLPNGKEEKHNFVRGKQDPAFLGEQNQVIVLASLDGQRCYLLRHDLYPLALGSGV